MAAYVPKIKRIGHLALFVKDPEASARWYTQVLGMTRVVTVEAEPYTGGIFMSFGSSDHDIGLFKRSTAITSGQEFEHFGLELDCRDDIDVLRRFLGSLKQHDVQVRDIRDHGVSKGVYFFDPDGHMVEVFCQQIHGTHAMAELRNNKGMAAPYALEPIY